jgi:hypothetical protein
LKFILNLHQQNQDLWDNDNAKCTKDLQENCLLVGEKEKRRYAEVAVERECR